MRKTGTRLTAVVMVGLLAAIWLSCGDTFRPVANPTFPPGGDPQGQRNAVALNHAGGAIGSTTHINVSGDTVVATFTVGKGPVHMTAGPGGSRIFVANAGDDTVSSYFTFSPGTTPTTISLPAGSVPVFVNTTQNTRAYVANSGTARVGVIDSATQTLTDSIPVGNNPVALAELPNGSKVYCVNQTDGTVSVIDTTTDMVTTTLNVGGAGAAPNFLFFDKSLKRVYVTNSGNNTVSIIRTDLTTPAILGTPITVGTTPVSVTALADGSRAYVANSGSANVSVINTSNNTVSKTITVGTNPVSIASSSDSTKVYVANKGSNTVSVIRTTDDTVVVNVPASEPLWVLTAP